jgi:hypothetical protein
MKQQINSVSDLPNVIASLEKKSAIQKNRINEEIVQLEENLSLRTLIKNNKTVVLLAVAGLGASLLVRKILIGKTRGFLMQTLGRVILYGIAAYASKNAGRITKNTSPIARKIYNKNRLLPDPGIIEINAR